MLHPATKKLIDRLVEMTALGKIDWKESEGDTVTYTTEGYSVMLESEPNEFVITASDGRELERGTVEDLAEAKDADGTSYTDRIGEMTREANRKAKGIDKAITTLLAGIDLDGDGIPDIPAEALTTDTDELLLEEAVEDTGDESTVVSVAEVEAMAEAADEAGIEDGHDTPEDDMTVAVARLADEVNGRDNAENGFIGSEAELEPEIEAAADADAEGIESDIEGAQSVATFDTEVEIAEVVSPDDEPVLAAPAEPAEMEAGTHDDNEDGSDLATGMIMGLGAASAAVVATAFASEAGETETEVKTELDPHMEDSDELLAQSVELGDVAGMTAAEAVNDVAERAEESAEFTFPADESFVEGTQEAASEALEAVSDTLESLPSETSEALSDAGEETISEAVDLVDEAGSFAAPLTEQAETIAEAVAPSENAFENGISLSGISAGFGLGALQASSEASGIPSIETSEAEPVAQAVERVVIDAIDEVPLSDVSDIARDERSTDESLPDVTAMQVSEDAPIEASETETEGDGAVVSMTPKTRFNPWT